MDAKGLDSSHEHGSRVSSNKPSQAKDQPFSDLLRITPQRVLFIAFWAYVHAAGVIWFVFRLLRVCASVRP